MHLILRSCRRRWYSNRRVNQERRIHRNEHKRTSLRKDREELQEDNRDPWQQVPVMDRLKVGGKIPIKTIKDEISVINTFLDI